MFTMIKRLAFVVLLPAVVGVGAWAQWTTFTLNAEAAVTPGAHFLPQWSLLAGAHANLGAGWGTKQYEQPIPLGTVTLI